MAIEVLWEDGSAAAAWDANAVHSTLIVTLSGGWTWDDLTTTANQVKAITDAAQPRIIGAILDLSAGVQFPGGTLFSKEALDNARKLLSMGQGGTGPVVIVGASPFIKMAYNTMYSLDPKALGSVRFAPTMAEARRELGIS